MDFNIRNILPKHPLKYCPPFFLFIDCTLLVWENVLDQPGSPVHLIDWDTGQVFVSMVTEEHFTLQGGKLVKYLYIITCKTILRTPANEINFCQPPT